MYFTANTPLFHYEIMMQRISNFLPRGHGIHVTVTQTPGTADCEYCLFFKRKKCALPCCPYIEDKIRTGTATLQQIMMETMSEIHCEHFRNRLNQYIKKSEKSCIQNCGRKWCNLHFLSFEVYTNLTKQKISMERRVSTKVSCAVWSGGKSYDHFFKGLPITIHPQDQRCGSHVLGIPFPQMQHRGDHPVICTAYEKLWSRR